MLTSLAVSMFAGCLATGEDGTNRPPTAAFTATPSTGKPPLTVALDASASADLDGRITKFAWAFGDGTQGEGITQRHTYLSQGNFTIALTVTDDVGVTASASMTVTSTAGLRPRVPVAAFSASPARGEAPLVVEFDARMSSDEDGKIVLHAWDFGDGGRATGTMPRHVFEETGVYDVTLAVIDDDGQRGETTMIIGATEEGAIPPIARFDATPSSGFAPLTVSFDATGTDPKDGTITEYAWQFGDNSNGTGATPSHTYANPGVFVAQMTATNSGGAFDSATRRLVVRGSVALPFNDDYAVDRGWIVVDDGDNNSPSRWRLDGGALLQASNIFGGDSSEGAIEKPGTLVYYGDPNWSDYRVSVMVTSTDDDAVGVIARYADRNNYYRFSLDVERGYARLVAKESGDYHLLAEDLDHPGFVQGTPTRLSLEVEGDQVRAYVDDMQVLTATDTRHLSGAAGLYTWANESARFDDLEVRRP